jgi:hypothetical protein
MLFFVCPFVVDVDVQKNFVQQTNFIGRLNKKIQSWKKLNFMSIKLQFNFLLFSTNKNDSFWNQNDWSLDFERNWNEFRPKSKGYFKQTIKICSWLCTSFFFTQRDYLQEKEFQVEDCVQIALHSLKFQEIVQQSNVWLVKQDSACAVWNQNVM